MAKDFKNEYEQHVHNTAPDMDLLWSKIESEIDKKQAENTQKPNITQTKQNGFGKFIAVAAAVLVVFAGVKAFNESSLPVDNSKNSASSQAEQNSYNNSENENQTNDDNCTAEENDNSPTIESEDNTSENAQTIEYDKLSLNVTPTSSYKSGYSAGGNEFFVEQRVLADTEFFADVYVEKAILGKYQAQYTLNALAIYSKDGSVTQENITLTCSSPYILQQNREYFIPLGKADGKWYITFENAPQIEITLDDEIVFHNGWEVLSENSGYVKKNSDSSNDFYYDRMRYSFKDDLDNLLEKWYNA